MRAWAVVVVVSAGAAMAAEREVAGSAAKAAAGGVAGAWAWLESGASGGASYPSWLLGDGRAGAWWSVAVGWGFEAGAVHLRPSARVGLEAQALPRALEPFLGSPVSLALAATDLLDDARFTGLRLTPAVGVTVPTRVAYGVALTTLSGALQLERRLGPVELALRAEVSKPFWPQLSCDEPPCRNPINWAFDGALQAEWWPDRATSVGVRLGYQLAFNFLLGGALGVPAQTFPDARQSTSGSLWLNRAFHRYWGLSFELTSQQALRRPDAQLHVPFFGLARVTGSVSLWFRSDATLERNWLER